MTKRKKNLSVVEGTFPVCAEQCGQCLFTKDRIVSKERAAEIIRSLDADDGRFFECHKHTQAGRAVMCRGDYNRDPFRAVMVRVATSFGLLRFVDEAGRVIPEGENR